MPKILVIGSTGHAHVQCVSWKNISSVNLVDYDCVVINTRSLDESVLISLRYGFFDSVRTGLARLLNSGGALIVLGDKYRKSPDNAINRLHNYSWSPIQIGIVEEAGDTVQLKTSTLRNLLSLLKEWEYYYFIPQDCLTSEMTSICGSTSDYRYSHDAELIAVNRYGKMLAGEITFKVNKKNSTVESKLGPMLLLPVITGVDQRRAVNVILEALTSKPQETVAPDWVAEVSIPLVDEILNSINENAEKINCLKDEIEALEKQKIIIEEYKKLLYADGQELEQIFSRCLAELGAVIKSAKYSQEEFIVERNSDVYLVECKGITKSVSLAHVRQLFDYMTKYEEDEGMPGKGILFGNAWKDGPISNRNTPETVVFPSNVISRATALGIALLSSVAFYEIFCRYLAKEITGAAILDRIVRSVGVVDFKDLT